MRVCTKPDSGAVEASPLFHGLSAAERSRLSGILHRKSVPAGTTVVLADEPGDVVYVILGGTIKVLVQREDGTEVILALLGPGDVLGEMSLLDSLGRSASAVTMDRSTLAWTDSATFWECLRMMPVLVYNLAEVLSRRLRLANSQLRALATLDVDGRIARQVLAFAHEYGEAAANGDILIPVRLTQNDLAGLVGASRVRVNQVLGAFKRHRYLSIDRSHRIIVHDQVALSRRCA